MWKDTSNHWSKDPQKKAIVMAKIGKHLLRGGQVGVPRDPEVIRKLNEGLKRWRGTTHNSVSDRTPTVDGTSRTSTSSRSTSGTRSSAPW